MTKKETPDLTTASLHILAMVFMFCDHAWAVLFPAAEWLTCIGRIAYPIFAFLLVEGFFHTSNLRRYLLRLLAGALLSEIPFNLMCGGGLLYPYHQNVLWTFLISLTLIALLEKTRRRFRPVPAVLLSTLLVLLGTLLGYAAMTDYYGPGILMVLTFYFFRGQDWKRRLLQLLSLYWINTELLGSYYYDITVGGLNLAIYQQSFALLALLPIWLYRGRQGHHSRAFQSFCYLFYPLHMLVLLLAHEIFFA